MGSLLGIILIGSVIANGLVASKMRGQSIPMASALIAALLMCVGLGIFFTWT
jgi:hypothetical protein